MNIILVSSDYPPRKWGGISLYTRTAAQNLTQLGHKVTVIASSFDDKKSITFEGNVRTIWLGKKYGIFDDWIHWRLKNWVRKFGKWLGVGDVFYHLRKNIARSMAVATAISELDRLEGIDIIEFPEYRAESFWYSSFGRGNIPHIVKLHLPSFLGENLDGRKLGFDMKANSILENIISFRATCLVSPCSLMVDEVKCEWKLSNKPIVLLPNGVDSNFFQFENTVPRRNIVLYAGHIRWLKGVQLLPDVFSRIINHVPDVEFWIVGEDTKGAPDGKSLKEYIEKKLPLNQRNQFVFKGALSQKELSLTYQKARVFLLPSYWDTFPGVCLEAMSSGVPVITTTRTGMIDVIEHGVDGFLVEPDDVDEMARFSIALLADHNWADKIAFMARKKIEETYSLSKIFKRQIELYKKVAFKEEAI